MRRVLNAEPGLICNHVVSPDEQSGTQAATCNRQADIDIVTTLLSALFLVLSSPPFVHTNISPSPCFPALFLPLLAAFAPSLYLDCSHDDPLVSPSALLLNHLSLGTELL